MNERADSLQKYNRDLQPEDGLGMFRAMKYAAPYVLAFWSTVGYVAWRLMR